MRRFLIVISVLLVAGSRSVVAQTYSSMDGTIWEYVWDDNMHRDFIAFISDVKAISYSYELDEFEISNYYINNDTIIVTTTDIDDAYNERTIVSITYYYKNRNDFLDLLFVIFRYEDGYRKEMPTESYRLYRKSNE